MYYNQYMREILCKRLYKCSPHLISVNPSDLRIPDELLPS